MTLPPLSEDPRAFSKPPSAPSPSSLGVPEAASVGALTREMNELKRRLSQVYSPTVLCHNDLLTKNIVYHETKGKLRQQAKAIAMERENT